jgi:prolyl oligopeptidase
MTLCHFQSSSSARACLGAAVATLLAACAQPAALDQRPAANAPTAAPVSAEAPRSASGVTVAPVRPVAETFFGQSVTDPYRYMEEVKSPEVTAFLRGQGEHSRRTLDAIPGRNALAQRIEQLSQASASISGVQQVSSGGRVFYYKISPGETMRKLYVRDGLNGAERMLFDSQTISKPGQRFSLDFYRASPDGAVVVVGVAASGSEDTTLRLINANSGRETDTVIDRIGFADQTHWAPDSKSFFYNRRPATEGAKDRYLKSVAYRHVLGRDASKDEAVFGPGASAGVTFADIDIPGVEQTADGRYLIGRVEHGDLREISLYVADASQVGGTINWRRAVEQKDGVVDYAAHSTGLYMRSSKDAPRFKIMRASFPQPTFQSATAVVPQGDTVIAEMALAQDALYIREMHGGVDRLQRLNFSTTRYTGGRLEFVRLPFDLAIRQMITDAKRPGALLRLEGWTEPPKYVNIEERTGNLIETSLQPPSPVDYSDITEVRLYATAKDGAKIPVSLMYKKGLTLNGINPTLLRAYGAYGISMEPSFSPTALAWLERGGIIGTCHVRGGGEYGADWHRAGQKLNKPNSWRDLIACSEYLVQRQFTSPRRLAIQGGSAGGITVGRALTERPDLFAAVVPAVGVLDALRAEFTPNGPPNIPEFGTVKTEDGFKGLLQMSSLHHVKDGADYPAVLLMHGTNDPRVEVWHSAKMAARLQAAQAKNRGAKPVLLRLDYDAGHGVGSTRSQRNAELADIYAFLLWQFSDPQFQPR